MARHWSVFVPGVSEAQAYALDKMVEANELRGDGCDLLAKIAGCSRSKIGKYDRRSLRLVIDKAFAQYGRK